MGIAGVLIGVTVGWWLGGPIGMVIGGLIGAASESSGAIKNILTDNDSSRQSRNGFYASLLVLMAAVMKADGRVRQSELEYVKKYLVRALGIQQASESLIMLRDILKNDIPIQDVCMQIRINLDYSSRLELLHLLYGIGMSDGHLDVSESKQIYFIASQLGISANDILSIQNTYYNTIESAYKILEISEDASNDDIKKAYRKMALRYHPDKVEHLGDEFKKSANEKFQKVNEAYEKIKKNRGFN
ncbi:MAG: TerB family tellurite resistance protein [Marinilabiliaceae bacterium]|nr:TerB family tellurite resistance protein [Marinilabiliaceae bacterium]